MSIDSLESGLVGVAGEYLVAGELSLRGYVATITLRNTRGADIIVTNSNASKSVSIQVKASKKSTPRWVLTKSSETFFSENHFYIFVAFRDLSFRPDFYVVPSEVVAEYVKRTHSEWLNGKKKDGTNRKDSAMRVFRDESEKYKEAWGRLSL